MSDENAGIPIDWHELLSVDPGSVTAKIRLDMEQVWRLVSVPYPQPETLACATALLANVMGSIREVKPVWLSTTDENDHLEKPDPLWVLQEDLTRVAIQVLGFAQPDQSAETVAVGMRNAIDDAASSGMLESQRFDAWRPGMPSGSGWTMQYRPTPYGVVYAQSVQERANGFHPKSIYQPQQSSHRVREQDHTGSTESEAVKLSFAADVGDAGDCSRPFVAAAQASATIGDIIVNNTIQIDHLAVAYEVLAELARHDGVESTSTETSGKQDTPADASEPHLQPGKGMAIAEVIRRAEEYVRSHEGAFPGRNKLAKYIRCAPSSVTKAIKRSTYLKARQAEHEAANRSGREVQVSGSMDEFEANASAEPADYNNREAELERLIAEQEAVQRRDERQFRAAKRQTKAD